MLSKLFSSDDYTNLNNGQDITTSIPANGMRGFYFQNVTPYVFHVYDDIDNLVAVLSPWQNVIGSITQTTQALRISSDRTAASVAVANVTPTQWNVSCELSINEQPAQVVPLPYANAANTNVTGDMTISGTPNVTVASGNINTNTLVVNQSTQAVPTQQQSYYGSGADGAFSPAGTWNTILNDNLTSKGTWNLWSGTGSFSSNGFTSTANGTKIFSPVRVGTACRIIATFTTGATVPQNMQIGVNDISGLSNAIGWWAGFTSAFPNNFSYGWGQPGGGTNSIWGGQAPYTLQPNTQYTMMWEYHNKSISGHNSMAAYLYAGANTSGTLLASCTGHVETARIGQSLTPVIVADNGTIVNNVQAVEFGYIINNTANQADIKNFTSVSINEDITVRYKNNTEYVAWFVNGDCEIDGVVLCATAIPNASTSGTITLFNGNISVSKGGNGGNGGSGGSNNNGTPYYYPGGSGGTASAYGSGSGGGGGGGNVGNNSNGGSGGGSGGNGAGTSNGGGGGNNGGNGATSGTAGDNVSNTVCATLIVISNGTITINGAIAGNGSYGGNGGTGGNYTQVSGTSYWGGGGGGAAGAGVSGNGGQGSNGIATGIGAYQAPGGGGGGGAGGASILLYSAKATNVNGSINVNGGSGGNAGANGNGSGALNASNGNGGQAGTIKIYQYNNAIAG